MRKIVVCLKKRSHCDSDVRNNPYMYVLTLGGMQRVRLWLNYKVGGPICRNVHFQCKNSVCMMRTYQCCFLPRIQKFSDFKVQFLEIPQAVYTTLIWYVKYVDRVIWMQSYGCIYARQHRQHTVRKTLHMMFSVN